MRAYERLLNYVTVHTQSAEGTGSSPSTRRQWTLARMLEEELAGLGMQQVQVSPYCVVTAVLPATAGCEDVPALGFIAHMDTSPAFSGEHVRPVLHFHYDGGDVALPKEGRTLLVSDFPFLKNWKGRTLITADGSTLLGADDKAGIAEIMTLCEELIASGAPHGKICVGFTPDEEIGEGPDHFDVAAFGAQFGYTLDGDIEGGIEYENFNAAGARVEITGVSVHPGTAKDTMENAVLIGMELNAKLPPEAVPARTAGYQGFFHLDEFTGTTAAARMAYIIRDHDMAKFQEKKALLEKAVAETQAAHPKAKVVLHMRDSYYNMAGQLKDCMHLIENAKKAAELAEVPPVVEPIRGGTDGARLSFMGLPCPNLGTGGMNFHGPYECITVEGMDAVVKILHNIVALYANQ